jgi:hypothetical protein
MKKSGNGKVNIKNRSFVQKKFTNLPFNSLNIYTVVMACLENVVPVVIL